MTKHENINQFTSYLIIRELYKCGIRSFYISPGSRSTALTLAVADLALEKKDLSVHLAVDERASAFMCLGYSKATHTPGVLICTSGSALANYFPAIVEAKYSCNSMLILSADRPDELQDSGANQTIRQNGLYGDYAKFSKEIDCSDVNIDIKYLLSTLDYSAFIAKSESGIVHLNCKFREPFFGSIFFAGELEPILNEKIKINEPFTQYFSPHTKCNSHIKIGDSKKVIIILGGTRDFADANAVIRFAEKNCLPVFPDILSNARCISSPTIMQNYDLWINKLSNAYFPDTILHFGTTIVSKDLQHFINKSVAQGCQNIIINSQYSKYDPESNAKIISRLSYVDFINTLENIEINAEYFSSFSRIGAKVTSILDDLLDNQYNSLEYKVVSSINKLIPEFSNLFLGNSLTIRNFDSYFFVDSGRSKQLNIFANRGASGIDGNLATAIGIAEANNLSTTIVFGDLSAFHDLNSLCLVANSKVKIIVVIMNNNGGGIFHRLPVRESKHFEKYFATPLALNFENIARTFGVKYSQVTLSKQFETQYLEAVRNPMSCVIEVRSDRESNQEFRNNLLQEISRSIDIIKQENA